MCLLAFKTPDVECNASEIQKKVDHRMRISFFFFAVQSFNIVIVNERSYCVETNNGIRDRS